MPNMSKFRHGLPLMGVVAAAAGLVGCADESPWGNSSNEKGTIDISLFANADVNSTIPVFMADEDETRADDPYNLGTYVNIPKAEDFSIKLVKSDGSYNKTWNSLAAFKEEAKDQFVTGAYTLTAFYGEKNKTAFNNPYFETSETFTVLANETHKLDLNAGLSNSMVKINFTDDFKKYMSKYEVGIRTEGQTDEFKYREGETRPVFVQPENTNLTLHYTTRDTGVEASKSLGQFIPLAKTLHNLTLDVRTMDGMTGVGVMFNDSLETEDVFIDLSSGFKDMLKAPVITCTGFQNGGTVSLLENSVSEDHLEMEVIAEAGIESAILTVSTTNASPAWGKEIDLCKANATQQQQIAEAGIKAVGFFKNPDKAAILDLTEYGKSLSKGKYTISLRIIDKNKNESEASSVVFDFEGMRFENVSGTVDYGKSRATLKLDYNGFDPSEIAFKSAGMDGLPADVEVESYDESNSTRAFDTKTYTYTLILPRPATLRQTEITAYNKATGKDFGKHNIELKTIPTYNITTIDAYSKYAYMKVDAASSLLATITNNIRFEDTQLFIAARDTVNGVLTVTAPNFGELQSGKPYNDKKYSIFPNDFSYGKTVTFTTETATQVPNGDFENLTQTINATIDQGGKWTQTNLSTAHRYTTTLTMTIKEPTGWYSSNPTTCNLQASTKNSWYVIPSVYNTTLSWVSNQPEAKVGVTGQSAHTTTADVYKNLSAASGSNAMVIRNVAWDLNGAKISDDQKTGNTSFSNYYCSNEPSSIANRTAGYMRLGSVNSEGAAFSSRPSTLKGFYMYVPDRQDTNEKGVVTVKLLNGSDVIGSGSIELGEQDSYTEFEIPIKYTTTRFGKKATSLQISITSSNKTSDIKTTNYCNKDECCSRGAALTIDNLTFEY